MLKSCYCRNDEADKMIGYLKRYLSTQNNKISNPLSKVVQKRSLRTVKSVNSMRSSQQAMSIRQTPVKYQRPAYLQHRKSPSAHPRINYQEKQIMEMPLQLQQKKVIYPHQTIKIMKVSPRNMLSFYKQMQFQFKPEFQQQIQRSSIINKQESVQHQQFPSYIISQSSQKQSENQFYRIKRPLCLSLIEQEEQKNLMSTHFSEYNDQRNNDKALMIKSTISMVSSRSPKISQIIQRGNSPSRITKLT